MPTATSFSWTLPWPEIVGGFNSFINMLNTPIALAVAILLAIFVAGMVIDSVVMSKFSVFSRDNGAAAALAGAGAGGGESTGPDVTETEDDADTSEFDGYDDFVGF